MPTSAHGAKSHCTSVPTAMRSAKFVFLRREAKKPLETPYVGPYEVLAKHEKYYTLQMGNRQEKVSIDRLKAAIVDQQLPVQVAQPPKRGRPPVKPLNNKHRQEELVQIQPSYAEVTSRSGRTVKPPIRLEYAS